MERRGTPQHVVQWDSPTVLREWPDAVRRRDLRLGDWLLVTTRNSVYSVAFVGDGRFRVSGGWFERNGLSPATVGINGCTFGGRAILCDLVAAPGLFLEFANHVTTTRIQRVDIVPAASDDVVN